MFSISGKDMNPLLRLKFVSECFMFCFSGRCVLLICSTFYDLLEMFNWEFHLSQHSTGNWKSVISFGMSDGGHKTRGPWATSLTQENSSNQ